MSTISSDFTYDPPPPPPPPATGTGTGSGIGIRTADATPPYAFGNGNPPRPTLADIPLLPRRRLRDGSRACSSRSRSSSSSGSGSRRSRTTRAMLGEVAVARTRALRPGPGPDRRLRGTSPLSIGSSDLSELPSEAELGPGPFTAGGSASLNPSDRQQKEGGDDSDEGSEPLAVTSRGKKPRLQVPSSRPGIKRGGSTSRSGPGQTNATQHPSTESTAAGQAVNTTSASASATAAQRPNQLNLLELIDSMDQDQNQNQNSPPPPRIVRSLDGEGVGEGNGPRRFTAKEKGKGRASAISIPVSSEGTGTGSGSGISNEDDDDQGEDESIQFTGTNKRVFEVEEDDDEDIELLNELQHQEKEFEITDITGIGTGVGPVTVVEEDEAEEAGSGLKEEEALSSFVCPVCFSEPTQAVMIVCGHILCSECLHSSLLSAIARSPNPHPMNHPPQRPKATRGKGKRSLPPSGSGRAVRTAPQPNSWTAESLRDMWTAHLDRDFNLRAKEAGLEVDTEDWRAVKSAEEEGRAERGGVKVEEVLKGLWKVEDKYWVIEGECPVCRMSIPGGYGPPGTGIGGIIHLHNRLQVAPKRVKAGR